MKRRQAPPHRRSVCKCRECQSRNRMRSSVRRVIKHAVQHCKESGKHVAYCKLISRVMSMPKTIKILVFEAFENNGETILMKAANNGYIKIIKVLLLKSANLNIIDKNGINYFNAGTREVNALFFHQRTGRLT